MTRSVITFRFQAGFSKEDLVAIAKIMGRDESRPLTKSDVNKFIRDAVVERIEQGENRNERTEGHRGTGGRDR